MAAVPIIGAVLGGLAGSQPDNAHQGGFDRSGINLKDASEFEKQLTADQKKQYDSLGSLVSAGPGRSDVFASTEASRSLAGMLQEYAKTGGLPGQQDYDVARGIAAQQFDPQRTALNQQFEQDTIGANRQAALMGRSLNDPILRNKLLQNKNNQFAMLNSQQNAAATNFALQQPMQRLGFAAQLADVRGSLASQAMSNRQTLLSLGNTLQQQERNFRLQTSDQWSSMNHTSQSGGGLKGGIEGAFAGAGAAMSMANGMGGMSAMGGGGAAAGGGSGVFGGSLGGGGSPGFGFSSMINSTPRMGSFQAPMAMPAPAMSPYGPYASGYQMPTQQPFIQPPQGGYLSGGGSYR